MVPVVVILYEKRDVMDDSIDSFVRKLKEEGIQDGMDAAGRIIDETREKAEKIILEAEAEAERIVSESRTKAERISRQQRHELQFAARDVILLLRERISQGLLMFFEHETERIFDNEDFLAELIHDMAKEYAREDAGKTGPVIVRVSDEKSALAEWAVQRISEGRNGAGEHGLRVEKGFEIQGFEYRIAEATVEVTVESVAKLLCDFVTQHVRDSIEALEFEKK